MLPFDDWWEAKRAGFGGDDGAEFFRLTAVKEWVSVWSENQFDLAWLEITPRAMSLMVPAV
jgi:hypothetical protein